MIYDSVDIALTAEADVVFFDGDIFDTSFDPLVGTTQEMQVRSKFKAGSWRLRPSIGVIDHPIGQPNIEEVAIAWEDFLRASYVSDGLVMSEDLHIEAVPINNDTWLTLITLEVEPTDANEQRAAVSLFLFWDIAEQRFWYY